MFRELIELLTGTEDIYQNYSDFHQLKNDKMLKIYS